MVRGDSVAQRVRREFAIVRGMIVVDPLSGTKSAHLPLFCPSTHFAHPGVTNVIKNGADRAYVGNYTVLSWYRLYIDDDDNAEEWNDVTHYRTRDGICGTALVPILHLPIMMRLPVCERA